jgi:hypothetical protein
VGVALCGFESHLPHYSKTSMSWKQRVEVFLCVFIEGKV